MKILIDFFPVIAFFIAYYIPDDLSQRMTIATATAIIAAIISGMVNFYVASSFTGNVRVNFNLFGLLGLTLLFAIGPAFYLARHISEPGPGKEGT